MRQAEVKSIADQHGIAPLVPLEEVQHKRAHEITYPDYQTFLHQLCDEIDQHEEVAERRRHIKHLTCENFYQDRPLGSFNFRGEFEPLQYEAGDPYYVSSFFPYFIRTIVKEVTRSNARVRISPILDTVRRRAAARLYQAQIKQIQRRNWLASEREREAKQLVIRGNSFRRIRSANDYNNVQLLPVTKLIEKPLGRDTYGCTNPDCADIGMSEEAQNNQCPQCGAAVLHKPAPTVPVEDITAWDAQPAKVVDIDVVDTFALKLNIHAQSLLLSDFLRYSSLIQPSVARYFFRWASFEEGSFEDRGMRAQLEMRRSVGNWNGDGTVDTTWGNHRLVPYKEYYIEPSRYADYLFPRECEAVGGKKFAAGESALKHFPRGMKITRLGHTIVAVDDKAEKNREFVHIQWDQQNSTLWGFGVGERMIEPARATNEMMSLLWEILLREASGLTVINQNKIDREELVYRPGYVGQMRQPSAMDHPGDYIFAMPSTASRPDLVQAVEMNKSNFTLVSGGAFSTDGALPDQKGANTATGINMLREQSLANLGPSLQQIAEADVRTVEIIGDLIQETGMLDQYCRTHPEYCELELEAASECDFRTDFEVSYEEGSWMPQLESDKRADFVAAAQFGVHDPNMPIEQREKAAKVFNQDISTDGDEDQLRDEEITLESLIKLADKAAQLKLDEDQAALQVQAEFPIRMEYKGDIRSRHLNKWLLTDPGRKANNYLRRFIMDRVNGFMVLTAQVGAQTNAIAAAAAQPAMQATAALGGKPQMPQGKSGNPPNAPKR